MCGNDWEDLRVEWLGWKAGRTCGWGLVRAAGLRLSSAVVGAGGGWSAGPSGLLGSRFIMLNCPEIISKMPFMFLMNMDYLL